MADIFLRKEPKYLPFVYIASEGCVKHLTLPSKNRSYSHMRGQAVMPRRNAMGLGRRH